MQDMQKYEKMSRQELLTEIFRLQAELSAERGYREGLEVFLRAHGAVISSDFEEGNKHTIAQRRPYRNGYLTQEYRRNKKTGTLTGPYWQYRGVDDGKQINLYLGKTEDPEAKAEEKLASRRRR
jgi:hypothetical protein